MFRITRKVLSYFRAVRGGAAGEMSRNDTEYLRSSRANEARLNAAIAELNAGRGTVITISELRRTAGLRVHRD